MKKVSVVVPCYNAAGYLERCMEHLLNQTIGIENIEIILIDDASTDDGATWDIIMKYENLFPDTIIAIPLEQNMRQGGARNVGLSFAGGEYLMFCDADDWLAPQAAEHLYQRAVEYDADVVQFQLKTVYDVSNDACKEIKEGDESYLVTIDTEEKRKAFLLDDERAAIGNCSRKFYRMCMVQEYQCRFAQHLFFEEPVFTVPVLLYEKKHYFLDEELYFYYQSPNSTMRSDWNDRKMDFLKVWIMVVGDLEERGILQKYYDEISYLFFREGYVGNIHMLACKRCILGTEELHFMMNAVLKLFPNILGNPYVLKEKDVFRMFFRDILKLDITEKDTVTINYILKSCVDGGKKSC